MDRHRGAFEYDWRTRLHLPLSQVGEGMCWGEAYRITEVLSTDPSSAIAAAVAGWSHPLSREALVLADLFDLQHQAKARKRPPPYPRPWGTKERKRRGTARLTPSQLDALLAAHRDPPEEDTQHG